MLLLKKVVFCISILSSLLGSKSYAHQGSKKIVLPKLGDFGTYRRYCGYHLEWADASKQTIIAESIPNFIYPVECLVSGDIEYWECNLNRKKCFLSGNHKYQKTIEFLPDGNFITKMSSSDGRTFIVKYRHEDN